MARPSNIDSTPILGKEELVNWFEAGCTTEDKRLIGVEHEKPAFYLDDCTPVSFDAAGDRKGMADFVAAMVAAGWDAGAAERDRIIEIYKDSATWTFEPGVQMESGGTPLRTVHQIAAEADAVTDEAIRVTRHLGIGMLAAGYHPTVRGVDMPLMPKSRYEMMRGYIRAHKYDNVLDTMNCTSSMQVNMGFVSEDNMVKMLRVSLSLQPVAVALFANSPFAEGRLTGFQSFRSHKIHNNMGGRYGFMLPIAFDDGFGFEMFTDYALAAMPVLGVYKGNVMIDGRAGKFTDFIKGRMRACKNQKATISDWQNHLNTIWPEVRLRRFLEMRGTDSGPLEMMKALPAFWAGLLYDDTSLDAAYNMVRDWTQQDREYLRLVTPNTGLQTPFLNTTVQELAQNCLAIATAGLKRRAALNAQGQDETMFLDPLHEIAASGLNWAQRLEDRFRNVWQGDIRRIYADMDFAAQPSVLKTARPHAAAQAQPKNNPKPRR